MTSLTDTQVVTASGGLVELASVSKNANQVITNGAAAATVMGPLTFVADGSACVVDLYVPRISAAGSTDFYFLIEIDGAAPAGITQPRVWNWTPTALTNVPASAQFRFTPSAGSHTVTIKAVSVGADTTVTCQPSNWTPAFLRVSKIVQATQWPAVTTGTIICTSTTRPASPFEGQTIYETDTDLEQRWTGSAWSQIWPQLFVTASDTTTQTGAFGSDFVYATATITLTPGVWLVQGSAVLFNTVTSDAACVGLYNVTTAAEVTNSRGPNGTVSTGHSSQLTSRLVQMSVSVSTNVRVLCTRNGASTIRCGSASGAPAAALWAQKVG
jgi:hypothetical protein